MHSDEFIEPSMKARALLVLLAGIGIAAALLVPPAIESLGQIPADATIEEIRAAEERLVFWMGIMGLGAFVATAVASVTLFRIGSATLTSGQSPPPGALRVLRTRIRRGKCARWSGYFFRVLAFIFWILIVLWLALVFFGMYLLS